VDKIISISAVGSLVEKIPPEDFVIPDQIIDRTQHRSSTFFGEGLVGHISMADPFCTSLSDIVYQVVSFSRRDHVHKGGTYICMEGPAFSTRAESNLYRSWGASIIGMTGIPECKLAREAEICYSMIAMSTDYDCWKVEESPVTVETVIEHMRRNTQNVKKMVPDLIKKAYEHIECVNHSAVKHAVLSAKDRVPNKIKKKLALLYGKYL